MSAAAVPAPGAARQVAVPADARARSTLSRIDYEDAFLTDVPAAGARTAEEWARTILEAAPLRVRATLLAGWTGLGLKLGYSRSRDFVLGWKVRRRSADFVLLGAGSRIGMPAELLLERRPGALLFDTFVSLENPVARLVWAGVEPLHRPVVRSVLKHGVRALSMGA